METVLSRENGSSPCEIWLRCYKNNSKFRVICRVHRQMVGSGLLLREAQLAPASFAFLLSRNGLFLLGLGRLYRRKRGREANERQHDVERNEKVKKRSLPIECIFEHSAQVRVTPAGVNGRRGGGHGAIHAVDKHSCLQ